MDNLKNLMSCIDDISKMIPEGTYLEMCDNMRKVHASLPKNDDPPVRDNRRPRVSVPFQVVQPGVAVHRIINYAESESESENESDDEAWQPEWYDEWTQNEDMIRRLLADLKVAKTSLRTLKPIQRITKKVREAAMKYFAVSTPLFGYNVFYVNRSVDGVHAEATFENYVRLTDWSEFSEQERKKLTSKKFERQIYEEYKMFENPRIERLISETGELKRNLEIEIADVRERQSYLRHHYNL